MEGDRKSSLRSKRKPLSDCTNTPQNLSSSKLIAQTLTKPPKKPSNFTTATKNPNKKRIKNPNSNVNSFNINVNYNNNDNNSNPVSSNSVKSHTSTGSNNSPASTCDPSQPPTPLSRAAGVDSRKFRPSATQIQRQVEQTRKDTGKLVEATPTVQGSTYLPPRASQISSSAVSHNVSHVSRAPAVENHELDAQKRKDKGKMVVETPIIHISAPLTSHAFQTSSSAASGNTVRGSTYLPPRAVQISSSVVSHNVSDVSRPPAVENRELDEQRRKDKGKMVVETPIIHISAPSASHALETSSSAASGNTVRGSTYLPPPSVQISSSIVSHDVSHVSRPPAVENREIDEQKRKDKGKIVVETPIIDISAPSASHALETSSSAASGNCYLPGPSAVHCHKQDTQAEKDYRKIVREMANIEAYGPATPRSLTISSSTESGTDGQEKTGLIVYKQRRASQRKKLAAGSISLAFSCPPRKRTKKNGVDLDGSGGDNHSGSLTDPLPLHRKKRSRNKKDGSMHAMPQDEVDKLKAYFADIDAFDLPEEVASESE